MTLEKAQQLYKEKEDRFNDTVDTINRLRGEGKFEEALERARSYHPDLQQLFIAAKDLEQAEREVRFQVNE